MEPTATPQVPLACVPAAIPADERTAHFALAQRLFTGSVQERGDLLDGLAFRFAADDFEQVARFVANERRCCPFLRFEIAVEPDGGPDGGPVWLRMTGPAGTRDFLRAELRL
jgi:hypothetical protein